jgi:hypothetical protein
MSKQSYEEKEHYRKLVVFLDEIRMNPYVFSYLLGKKARIHFNKLVEDLGHLLVTTPKNIIKKFFN